MHMDRTQGSWNLAVGVYDLRMLVTRRWGPAGLRTETLFVCKLSHVIDAAGPRVSLWIARSGCLKVVPPGAWPVQGVARPSVCAR